MKTTARLGGLLGLVAISCANGQDGPVEERFGSTKSALTAVETNALAFEDASLWQVAVGPATLSQSNLHSEGLHSLAVSNFGYVQVRNAVPLANDGSTPPTVVGYDVRIPQDQLNQWWLGNTELYINAPSVGIWGQYLGHREFQGFPREQFQRVEFAIPQWMQTALHGNYNDLTFTIVINVTEGNGTYYLDHFTLGPTSGVCTPQSDNNPCTVDACDATTGQTTHTPALGASCADANPCNGSEICDASGACQASTPPSLDDGNPCTIDSCSPGTGISHVPAASGTNCSDGNACNGTETCNGSGQCAGGAPLVVDDGNVCTTDSCDPTTGVSHVAVAAGTSCSDGNACNGAELCAAGGSCAPGTSPATDDGNPCTADSCDAVQGVIHVAVAAGTSCADGNVCNGAETCNSSGSCVPGVLPQVDDGNPCTADSCGPSGIVHVPVAAGISCSDGNACNGTEVCNGAGTCAVGVSPSVDDGNPCTSDSCDPQSGAVHVAVAAGTACGDGNACNGAETCNSSGTCAPGQAPVVDDGNPCTADSCDAAQGVVHVAVAAGVSCSDHNVCNGAEACDGSGSCSSGTAPSLDDGNPCTADACDAVAGVSHDAVAAGTECASATLCRGASTCDASATCQAGPEVPTDDNNPCTVDYCDAIFGVKHDSRPIGSICNDGNVCNGAELCDGSGHCDAGGALDVDDGNPCTADSCDANEGARHVAVSAGTACADGNVCNGAETCNGAGVCNAGVPLTTDDANVCTIDSCDPATGVAHTFASTGTSCADSDACNGNETCDGAGTCVAGTPPAINDGNPCTTDACIASSGVVHTPVAVGTSCADGDVCNGQEACSGSGACVTGAPLAVDDGDDCTIDSCDPVDGVSHERTYEGQCGCTKARETIVEKRRAQIVGRVVTWDAEAGEMVPVAGARIHLPERCEFGETVADENGAFILEVNGGDTFVLRASAEGYFPVDRPTQTRWGADSGVADIELTPQSPVGTTLATVAGSIPGSRVVTTNTTVTGETIHDDTNADGVVDFVRTPSMFFRAGTQIEATDPQGNLVPLTEATIRMTEYTVGPTGPNRMPAPLPPGTAYTYAIELSVDQAVDGGAQEVTFDKPVAFYLDNFVGKKIVSEGIANTDFQVGKKVPVWFYDRGAATWKAETDGLIVKIVGKNTSVFPSQAVLDVNGDGVANQADATYLASKGITIDAQELEQLGAQIPDTRKIGDELWRVERRHFSPMDLNWLAKLCPEGDCSVGELLHRLLFGGPVGDPKLQCGSVVSVETQVLSESLPIAGTPWSLTYSSEQVQGYQDRLTQPVFKASPISAASCRWMPDYLTVAGQKIFADGTSEDTPLGFVHHTDTGFWSSGFDIRWDGKGSSDELLMGTHFGTWTTRVRCTLFSAGGAFALDYPRNIPVSLTVYDAKVQGFGGWGFEPQHRFDRDGQILFRGDGRVVRAPSMSVIRLEKDLGPKSGTNPEVGVNPEIVAMGDGGYYLRGDFGLAHFTADGTRTNLITNQDVTGIAKGRNGELYASANNITSGANTIYKVVGTTLTAWRTGVRRFRAISVGPDGYVYGIMNRANGFNDDLVRVKGSGSGVTGIDLLEAFQQDSNHRALTFSANGTLYLGLSQGIYTWTPNDGLKALYGTGSDPLVDGASAKVADINGTTFNSLLVNQDGSILFARYGESLIWQIDTGGLLRRYAGRTDGNVGDLAGDNGPATRAHLGDGVAFDRAPDGSLLLVTRATGPQRVRRITPSIFVGAGLDGVPNEDGSEVYVFDQSGRHLKTLDGATGQAILTFKYEAGTNGLLTEVVHGDADGVNGASLPRTRIERAAGQAVVVSPFGQRTSMTLDPATGYASEIEDAAGATSLLEHDDQGLLWSMVDRRNQVHVYAYDAKGFLIQDVSPGNASQTLDKEPYRDTSNGKRKIGYTVDRTSPELSESSFVLDWDAGVTTRSTSYQDGSGWTSTVDASLNRSAVASDTTTSKDTFQPHVRFTDVVVPASSEITLPSGNKQRVDFTQSLVNDTLTETTKVNSAATGDTLVTNRTEKTRTATTAGGRQSVVTLDTLGRPVSTQLGTLAPALIGYDGDRLKTITIIDAASGQSRVTSFDYFSTGGVDNGYLEKITAPGGQVVSFTRDAFGRALTSTSNGQVTHFGYDAVGNLSSVTTSRGNLHQQDHSGVNLLDLYRAPFTTDEGGSVPRDTDLVWDGDRELSELAHPDGSGILFMRDPLDAAHPERFRRLRNVVGYSSNGETSGFGVQYVYADEVSAQAPKAQLRSVTRGSITTTLSWDGSVPIGEATTVQAGAGLTNASLAVALNNRFQPVSEQLTAGAGAASTAYGYDADRALTCAAWSGTCSGGSKLTWFFDGDPTDTQVSRHGLLERVTAGSVSETYAHTGFGELASVDVLVGGAPAVSVIYDDATAHRDPLGRVVTRTIVKGSIERSTTYHYDTKGQLSQVDEDGTTRRYAYDANGNRCELQGSATSCSADVSYDSQDRLRRYGNTEYAYTARGTLRQKDDGATLTTYTYDAMGNLTSVEGTPAGDIDYTIDAMNRRAAKHLNGALERQYVWSGGLRIAAELDGSGNLVSRFVYGTKPNAPELVVRPQSGGGEKVYRIITDQVGSPIYVVNVADANDVLLDADYDEWGKVTSYKVNGVANAGWPLPFGFAGGLYDEDTGLVRFGARDYDPEVGRWTSKDPILFGGGQANVYVYVHNDPVNFVDPRGKLAWFAAAVCLGGGCEAAAAAIGTAALWTTATLGAAWAGTALGKWLAGTLADGTPIPDWPGDDPTVAPEGYDWSGKPGSTQGGKDGNYFNPDIEASLRPDLEHAPPIGPHWDWTVGRGKKAKDFRIFPDGSCEPK